GDCRDARHAVADGDGADTALVGPRPLTTGCVDDQIDGTVGEVIEQIRAPFADLADGGDVYAVLEQCANSPAGSDQSKAHRGKSPGYWHDGLTIALGHAHEDGTARRQSAQGRELALGKSRGKVGVDAHDLAGRAHLGAEHDVHAGEL